MSKIEGKTKIITPYKDGKVLIKTKDTLSAGDGVKRAVITDIGKHKTTQTSKVFSLLNNNNIDTAFINKHSPNEMLCYDCDMLPIEWVIRRYAWGSYLTTHPWLKEKTQPHKLIGPPTLEMFHKLTLVNIGEPKLISENSAREKYLIDGKWDDNVYTDPLIALFNDKWTLYSRLGHSLKSKPLMDIEPLLSPDDLRLVIDNLVIPTFEVLEKAWSNIETSEGPVALADMKLEIGKRKSDGKYVVADVIDNDSWRIWPGGNPKKQLDKQCFRDDYNLNDVSKNYEIVTKLVESFS